MCVLLNSEKIGADLCCRFREKCKNRKSDVLQFRKLASLYRRLR